MKALATMSIAVVMTLALWIETAPRAASAQETAATGPNTEKLPPDIHPDTLSRMPRPKKEDMTTDDEKQSFDRVLAFEPSLKDATGDLKPTGIRAWIPQAAEEYRKVGNLNEKYGLDTKYVQLSYLVILRESNDQPLWAKGAISGAKVLGAKTVEVVRNGDDPSVLEDKKAAVIIRFGRELINQTKVSSSTFAEMERTFGRKGTLNITLLMGYYYQNALLSRAYDQRSEPDGQAPPW
jgi:hypothetical protein